MSRTISPSVTAIFLSVNLASFTTARPAPYERGYLLPRDDSDGYAEKAQSWCDSNPSGCKGVATVGGVIGVALILYLIFHCYRKKRRSKAAAREALQQQEQKAEQDQLEKKVQEKFFHRQRELKLKHDMEMLGFAT